MKKDKNKLYFIHPYPTGQAPSQRFRFEQFYDFYQKNGFQIKSYSFLTVKTWKLLYSNSRIIWKIFGVLVSFFRRIGHLFRLIFAKNIFIHREMTHIGPPIFEFILSKVFQKKYVYDFDDAIWLPNYSEQNARFQSLKCYWKVKFIIKWADKVVAGNEYLARYAAKYNAKVEVIPTTVDTEKQHNILVSHVPKERINIGWTGTHTTAKYLVSLVPALKKLQNFNLLIISNEEPSFDLPNLKFIKWRKETEIADLAKIDIGVMPLEESEWALGKCGFKAIQYMALGIPTVASPVGVNEDIINNNENGFLATNTDEWVAYLSVLINDYQLRENIGKKGRETIEKKYSLNSQKNNYLKLWD